MAKPRVTLIGVPLDLGAGRRGVDMGPSALRVADVDAKIAALGYEVDDWGDLPVKIRETQGPGDPRLKYLKEILEVCGRCATGWGRRSPQGSLPVVLGGDHSVAMGTIAGLTRHFQRTQREARAHLVRRARGRQHAPRPARAGTSTACRSPSCSATARRAS